MVQRSIVVLPVCVVSSLLGMACEGDVGPEGREGPPGDPGGVISVVVSPPLATIAAGDTATFTATSSDTTESISWATSDPSIATVDGSGVVTGVEVGSTFVSATGDTTGASAFAAVTVTEADQPVSFSADILPLFTMGNVWFVGSAACNASGCHTGVGGAHDLDMGSYDGIMLGADAGTEPIVVAGNAEESSLRGRLRNNRMPWGISPLVPRNGPEVMSLRDRLGWVDASSAADTNGLVKLVEAWIDADAPNGDFAYTDSVGTAVTKNFDVDVLPLFTTGEVWAPGTEACNAAGCHNGIGGAHDLDMGSYDGIMLGADGGAEPIVVAGNAEESSLRGRLRNNRMPWGMPTWVPRNGFNGEVNKVVEWIEGGAEDN